MPDEKCAIRVESLLDCFPFSFVLDREGRVARLGGYFAKHHADIAGRRCEEVFAEAGQVPAPPLSGKEAFAHARAGAFNRMEIAVREVESPHFVGTFLPQTGDDDGVLFVGTIAPKHIASVASHGLALSDFAPFDVSADYAMMAQVNEAVLKDTRVLNERLAAARDEAVKARKKVEAVALVDTLSGLCNRAAFQQMLEEVGGDGDLQTLGAACSLLLIDVDNFKPVNDHYGHAVGDQLIKSIGDRIGGAANGHARAYRIGGDEFAVYFRDVSPSRVRRLAGEIMRAVQSPHRIQDKSITVKASAGLASRMADVDDFESLYKAADIALYEAKRARIKKLQTFTAGMGRRELEKKLLERDLMEAVEGNELDVFVQPQFDIRTRALWGGEALARWWNRRLQRYIPPAVFIPIAEKYGLVSEIDLFVFATVLEQQNALGPNASHVTWSTNMSALSIGQEDLPQRMQAIVRRHGPLASHLEIEITEGAIMSEAATIGATLRSLRDMGMEVAIDDFGAGQTSLSHLTRLPITRLKLDRSLVEKVDHDARAETIVRAIVVLAHELGLEVTAEGIERPSQASRMYRMGPMKMQGFLYAQPMPLAQFRAMVCNGGAIEADDSRAVG